MTQLKLTDEQKEILKRLNDVIQEAITAKIGFVHDIDSGNIDAYNASNVSEGYSGGYPEDDDVFLVFDEGYTTTLSLTNDAFCDYYDSAMESYFLKLNQLQTN